MAFQLCICSTHLYLCRSSFSPLRCRFREVYDYYSALFDSLDSTLPRESPDRMNVERQCLAREIVNILASEGPDRVERYFLTSFSLELWSLARCKLQYLKYQLKNNTVIAGTKWLGNGERE